MNLKYSRLISLLIVLGVFFIVSPLGAQSKPDALELYRQGQYTQAVQVCLQELEDRGTDESKRRMDSYTVLGWSYLRLGEYENALKYSRQARNEVRYDIRIVEIEAETLYYLGRNLEALTLFEEYISLSPTGERIDSVYYFMGEIFLRLAEFNHADIAFSTALHHSPQIARWWARLGYAREQIGDNEGADTAYSKALELKPSLEEAKVGLERVRGR
ncbi:MAG: tetratricopeptide repeat protein [Spirochaetaceae bacterium]|nr:tetratricopeptide repeat protein [Spirochaetaceae bacterium]